MDGFEIASFRGLRPRKLAISFLRFRFSSKHDSVGASEENDATEEARDDEIRRSVPSAAGPDHQPQARTGAARWPDRLGLYRRRDRTALQRQGPAGDSDAVRDRAVAAQAHLRDVRRRRVRALGL